VTPALENALDDVRGAWRYRWVAFILALSIAIIGWVIVFALPDRYEAAARVFVDTRTALKPVLQGLTMDQDTDAQINFVRQSLLAGPQLERIAIAAGVLPASVTDERKRAKILDEMSDRVIFSASGAGNPGDDRNTAGTIYGIMYLDPNRARCLEVVTQLLNSFVEQTLGGKREGSENAQKFLETQIKDYEQRLSAAEDSLAAFKKEHVGLMPSEQGGYFTQLQKEVDDSKSIESKLAIAMSRRDELTKELHSDAAVSAAGMSASVAGSAGAASGGDTLSRIQEAQAKLDELLLKYTDKHPDVLAARATLAELKERRETELESLRRGDPSAVAASGASSNPVYQSIELALNNTDVEIAALKRELAQHQGTVADLRRRLDSAPKVEAEYQQLNRDYDVNKAQYTALMENYQKARLGERADNAGSVRFEVVLPPTVTVGPVWPDRKKLLASIWLAALAAGAGAAYGLQRLRPPVGSLASLKALVGTFPVLGVVSVAFPTEKRIAFRRDLWRFSAATAVLVAALAITALLNRKGVRIDVAQLRSLVQM
jgi:polysaccharide chain length determinant protein (PEP-CTERM system associated)